MKMNDQIYIYQDGKLCRDISATIIGMRSGGLRISFVDDEHGVVNVWCRRRNKKGKYEAIGWNYWILPGYSVTGYQI